MISAQHKWFESVPSGQWLVCAQFAAAGFIPPSIFEGKFLPYCSTMTGEHKNFLASGIIIFLSFSLIFVVRVLTGAPLDTNYIYCCFYTFRLTKNYDSQLVFTTKAPFGKKWHLNRRLALRNPLVPSCLSLFSLFLRLSCIYVLFRQLFNFAQCW